MKKKIEDLHKNKRFRISYQVIFIFLALYSFVTTILDLHGDINIFNNPVLEFIDVSIYLIFAADYFIRFTHSDNKLDFIENNVPDLISIIPYYSIFRLFRIFKIRRFARVFKHLKLTKTYLAVKKFYKKSKKELKKFFNTSGILYRELELKDKLPEMTEDEMIKLLATDGKLVKRPMIVTKDFVLNGFKEEEWKEKLKK